MNTPKTAPENTRRDSLKKITAGAVLFGVLTSCGPNEWNNDTHALQMDTPRSEEMANSSSAPTAYVLKSPEEIAEIFRGLKPSEERQRKKNQRKIVESVENEYNRLLGFLGKTVFPVQVQTVPGNFVLYCSNEGAKELLEKYNNPNPNKTEMDSLPESAIALTPFTLTEETLKDIIRDYVQNPMFSLSEREIWMLLFE